MVCTHKRIRRTTNAHTHTHTHTHTIAGCVRPQHTERTYRGKPSAAQLAQGNIERASRWKMTQTQMRCVPDGGGWLLWQCLARIVESFPKICRTKFEKRVAQTGRQIHPTNRTKSFMFRHFHTFIELESMTIALSVMVLEYLLKFGMDENDVWLRFRHGGLSTIFRVPCMMKSSPSRNCVCTAVSCVGPRDGPTAQKISSLNHFSFLL